LLRSSATQPSVTASDEIQASLVSPRTARRAADLLSKVADYSGPYETADVGSPSHSHQASEAIMIQSNRVPSSTTTTLSTPTSSLNDWYFSFPNFDNWESPKSESVKEYP
jgi:hypothetical protein